MKILSEVIREMVSDAERRRFDIMKLIFINHRRFADFKTVGGKQRLCVIEIENHDNKIQETWQDAKKEIFSQSHVFTSLISSLSQTFDFTQFLQSKELTKMLQQKEKIIEEMQMKQIPYLDQKTKNSLLALLVEPLIANWQTQNPLLRSKEILRKLKTMKGVKPWLRLGICPSCPDFQLVMGEFNTKLTKCPRAGHKQCEITVYVFDEEFSKLKLDDNDLPNFICEYIKNKTSLMLKPKVNKKLNSVEIDCYLSRTKLGIECKQFARDFTISKDSSQLILDIVEQMGKYHKAGIKRAILVSNVDDTQFTEFRKKIEDGINKNSINFEYFKIVNEPASLIKEIENEITFAAKIQKK